MPPICDGISQRSMIPLIWLMHTTDHDRAKIDIIIYISWAVYNNWTLEASGILGAVMRMIPRRSVKLCSHLLALLVHLYRSIFSYIPGRTEDIFTLYVKLCPGGIGHWVTPGTPSIHGVPVCKKPCQWIVVPSAGSSLMELVTFTSIQSPQLASINGPGNWSLTRSTRFSYPSGAITPRLMLKSYLRVIPVCGASV